MCAVSAEALSGRAPRWRSTRWTQRHSRRCSSKGGTEFILLGCLAQEVFLPAIKLTFSSRDISACPHRAPFPVLAIRGGAPGKDKEKTMVSKEAADMWMEVTGASEHSKVVTLDAQGWYLLEDAMEPVSRRSTMPRKPCRVH